MTPILFTTHVQAVHEVWPVDSFLVDFIAFPPKQGVRSFLSGADANRSDLLCPHPQHGLVISDELVAED